jgi:hypothetical protein
MLRPLATVLLTLGCAALARPGAPQARATSARFNEWTVLEMGRPDAVDQYHALCAAGDRLYYAGPRGSFVEIHGRQAKRHPTPTKGNLTVVWGRGPKEVYAVGLDGAAVRWDGRSVRPLGGGMPPVPYRSHPSLAPGKLDLRPEYLWASGPSDVYAAGFPSSLLHFDGVRWSRIALGAEQKIVPSASRLTRAVATPQVGPLWGTGSDDVFVGATEIYVPPREPGKLYLSAAERPQPREPQPVQVRHFDGIDWRRTDVLLRGERWENAGRDPAKPEVVNLPDGGALTRRDAAIYRWSRGEWVKVTTIPTTATSRYWPTWAAAPPNRLFLFGSGARGCEFQYYNGRTWSAIGGPQPELPGSPTAMAMTRDGWVGLLAGPQRQKLWVSRIR